MSLMSCTVSGFGNNLEKTTHFTMRNQRPRLIPVAKRRHWVIKTIKFSLFSKIVYCKDHSLRGHCHLFCLKIKFNHIYLCSYFFGLGFVQIVSISKKEVEIPMMIPMILYFRLLILDYVTRLVTKFLQKKND